MEPETALEMSVAGRKQSLRNEVGEIATPHLMAEQLRQPYDFARLEVKVNVHEDRT